jgi:UDP-N-acetylenolpyruvoylglucosamine reductase
MNQCSADHARNNKGNIKAMTIDPAYAAPLAAPGLYPGFCFNSFGSIFKNSAVDDDDVWKTVDCCCLKASDADT